MKGALLIAIFVLLSGVLSAASWQADFTEFVPTDKGKDRARFSTEARLEIRQQMLVVTWNCRAPKPLAFKEHGRDGMPWMDDCVELFLRPAVNRPEYYHFAVNGAGALFDQLCRPGEVGLHKDWNASECSVEIQETAGGYRATLSIPLKYLYRYGRQWALNMTRTTHADGTEYSSASGIKDGFHSEKAFLKVDAPHLPFVPGLEILSTGERKAGANLAKIAIRNDGGVKGRLQLRLEAGAGVTEQPVMLSGHADQLVEMTYQLAEVGGLFTAQLLDEAGEVLSETMRSIQVAEDLTLVQSAGNANVRIDENLNLVVGEKKVFPMIFYRVPQSIYRKLRDAGFNAVEVTNYRRDFQTFDGVAKAALNSGMGFLPHEDYSARRLLRGRLGKVVSRYRHHPALWCWYLADEPQNYGISPEHAQDLYRVVKKTAPELPVMLLNSEPKLFGSYAPACDVFAVDNYPVPKGKIVSIAEYLDQAYKAVEHKKPVWFAVQSFASFTYGGRFPTIPEFRCMVYLALVHKAKGLLFFAYGCPEMGGLLKDKNRLLYNAVLAVAGEIRELTPWLTAKETSEEVLCQGDVHSRVFSYGERDLLLVVNPFPKTVKAVVSWGGGRLEKSFAPYEVYQAWRKTR